MARKRREQESRPPGWYPDPFSATGEGERYWDGTRWGSNDAPLADHSARDESDEPPRRRRGFGLIVVAGLALLIGVVFAFGPLQKSDSKKTSSSTIASATTVTPDAQGCGNDCGKVLLGDWALLALGDCINVQSTSSDVSFTRVPCRGQHEGEVYFLARPDPLDRSASESAVAVRDRYCGPAVLAAYAPAFAASAPDAAASASMWGNGDQRVCTVVAPSHVGSIRDYAPAQ